MKSINGSFFVTGQVHIVDAAAPVQGMFPTDRVGKV